MRKIRQALSNLLYASLFLLPWKLRRPILNSLYGFKIHKKAWIGLSWVRPKRLIMGPHSYIDHLTMIKGLDLVELGEYVGVGRLNWISAFPSGSDKHFNLDEGREPVLIVGDHGSITNRHIIDCTNRITVGKYSTVAGFRSQLLTHSIDIIESRQRSYPIEIGDYTFVGTASIVLGGAKLPNCSVLGAGSVLNKAYEDEYWLYGGTPARAIKALPKDSAYFGRAMGFVD